MKNDAKVKLNPIWLAQMNALLDEGYTFGEAYEILKNRRKKLLEAT